MKRGKDLSIAKKEEIILMNRVERLSPQRIANKLSLSVNTVKTIVRKANQAGGGGKLPTLRGRSLSDSSASEQLIKRLQMENKLLRDFLQSTGRK